MDAIQKERDQCDFDKEELGQIIYETKEEHDERKLTLEFFRSDPILNIDHTFFNLPRDQQIALNYKRAVRMEELHKEGKGFPKPSMMNIGHLADFSGSVSSVGLHYGMFETVVKYLGSDEQCKELLPKIQTMEILGCYAQTEIGHGSDVASLETTATFDQDTDSFIVHSPKVTSGKFWPGELGKSSTHAAFHAQMIIHGKNYGVQTFVTQIRDLDSNRPLKGLEIGDIGPKGGYAQKDNGYMYFNNFQVPRTALLSKYVKVDKSGKFSLNGNPKFAYASMMFIRLYLIGTASKYLAKGLNASLKYGVIRKQFKTVSGSEDERQIINYHSYQAKITPVVAWTFAALFSYHRVLGMFKKMMTDITEKSEFGLLKEMHGMMSCLKALYTQKTLDYLKDIRETCGGHGYSEYVGLTNLIDIGAPNVTLEGDNFVMYQQTARTLLKSVSKIVQGKQLKGTLSYINDLMSFEGKKLKNFNPDDIEQLQNLLKVNAIYHLTNVGKLMQADQETSFMHKWNKKYQVDIVKVANAHAVYITAESFVNALKTLQMSASLRKHLETLCKIHLCHSIITCGDGAILSGYAKGKHLNAIEEFMYGKIEEIRPQILNLVEAFHYPEGTINTVVKPEGSDVYQNLYEAAAWNPLNKTTKLEAHDKYLTPLSQRMSARL